MNLLDVVMRNEEGKEYRSKKVFDNIYKMEKDTLMVKSYKDGFWYVSSIRVNELSTVEVEENRIDPREKVEAGEEYYSMSMIDGNIILYDFTEDDSILSESRKGNLVYFNDKEVAKELCERIDEVIIQFNKELDEKYK